MLTAKVGGAPAASSLEFQYDSPVIKAVTITSKPCPVSAAVEPATVDPGDSASQVRPALFVPGWGVVGW